ncbi:MAG: hypothetical protein ACF8XB_07095 [Planctomycetota bacterium JB042]
MEEGTSKRRAEFSTIAGKEPLATRPDTVYICAHWLDTQIGPPLPESHPMSSPAPGRPPSVPEPPRPQSTGEFLRNVAILLVVPLGALGIIFATLRWLHVI